MENEVFLANIQNLLRNHLLTWADIIKGYAMNLFLALAGIYLAVKIINTILESGGSMDAQKLMGFLARFTFVTGFFYFLLQNGIDLASNIVNSFIKIGNDALGYGNSDAGAVDKVLSAGYSIWQAVSNVDTGWIPDVEVLPLYIIAIIIFILLIVILGNYIVEIVSAWVMVYAGYFVLAFGGTEWTRDAVISYFKSVVAIGLKILTLMFLIGIAITLINSQIKNIHTNNFHINHGITILATVIIIVMIMNKVPDAIASLISGNWGHMSGLNMASAVATTMIAAQMAKTGFNIAKSGAGAAMQGARNYKTGANDFVSDYLNKKYPNQATQNQNNTFTPNDRNGVSGQNKEGLNRNGSGLAYQLGRGTGYLATKYSESKSSKKDTSDNKADSNTSKRNEQNDNKKP